MLEIWQLPVEQWDQDNIDMSKINIRKIKEIAQLKINSASGSTSLTDLEKLMKLAMLSGGGHLQVDSSGDLPDDGRVAHDLDGNRIFINQKGPNYTGTNWQPLQPTEFNPVTPTIYQGVSYGYSHGGISPSVNPINKYSFTSDGNATSVGHNHPSYPNGSYSFAPGMSETHGYNFGGRININYNYISDIIKFPYAVDEAATDTGVNLSSGNLAESPNNSLGLRDEMFYNQSYPTTTVLYKTPAASDTTQTSTGNLLPGVSNRNQATGTSSSYGYFVGGNPTNDTIQKFPFAISSGETSTDVANLIAVRQYLSGASSTTHGYASGGTPSSTTIEKYPFASDTNSSDVGDLNTPMYGAGGSSSTTHAYIHGGQYSSTRYNHIQKVPFTTDENATDVGDLTTARRDAGGSQV